MDFGAFRKLVVDFLTEANPANGGAYRELGADRDLLGSGLVDSHTFIDLCLAIEEKTGKMIDIAELDPDQFSTIAGLFRVVADKAA